VATRKPAKITTIPATRKTANAVIWPSTEFATPLAPVIAVPTAMSTLAMVMRPPR
jgi:hypothetical protein